MRTQFILFLIFIVVASSFLFFPLIPAQEAELEVNVIVLGNVSDFINIIEPKEGALYCNKKVPFHITTKEQVKFLHYQIKIVDSGNIKGWVKLCKDCSSYQRSKRMPSGKINLTIRAETYSGQYYYSSVVFTVDYIRPYIWVTYPPRTYPPYTQKSGYFVVGYTEFNVQNVTLKYGKWLENEVELENCPSGHRKSCWTKVNLTEYDEQYIYYRFIIRDKCNRYMLSELTKIYVDVPGNHSSNSSYGGGIHIYSEKQKKKLSLLRRIIFFFKRR